MVFPPGCVDTEHKLDEKVLRNRKAKITELKPVFHWNLSQILFLIFFEWYLQIFFNIPKLINIIYNVAVSNVYQIMTTKFTL